VPNRPAGAIRTLTWDPHRGQTASDDVVGLGSKYRIHELSAAVGIVQPERLEEFNAARAALVEQYDGQPVASPVLSMTAW
jgi:dTDP-4-amino-4,6-dideoxygalactose transaminase